MVSIGPRYCSQRNALESYIRLAPASKGARPLWTRVTAHPNAKLIWRIASPKWDFDDATFDRTAASFDNPDYVAIVIHNYRWRLGLADGERQYDELEARLAAGPVIPVPAITMEGDANGAPHAPAAVYRSKFSGRYEHRLITCGIGHNLPQEAPQAFAKAITDVAGS